MSTRNNTSEPQDHSLNNIEKHLDVCRDAVLSQENRNKEFSQKALGIITFSATLFGFGARRTIECPCPNAEELLIIGLGICSLLIAFMGLSFVIKPKGWKEPRRLDFYQDIAHNEKKGDYLITLVDTYRQAVEQNEPILESKAGSLRKISWIAVVQLTLFIALRLLC